MFYAGGQWIGQGARMPEMKGRKYELWCSGRGDGVGGVGVVVSEELFEKLLEVKNVK